MNNNDDEYIKLSTHLNENSKCLSDRRMEKFISADEFRVYFNSILHLALALLRFIAAELKHKNMFNIKSFATIKGIV